MSSSAFGGPPSEAALIHQLQVESDVVYSMTALLAYEYFLTLSQEVDVIWKRKWSGATWLFVLNRYSTIGLYIMNCTPGFSYQVCFDEDIFLYIFSLAQYVIFALFSALRIYVLWNRNIWWFLIILVLNLMPFGTNLYGAIVNIITYIPELSTCEGDYGGPPTAALPLSVSTRLSMIVADILVLVLTWVKTAATYRDARRLGIKTPIATLLLRDGTIYFAVVLILNIYQILSDNIPMAVIVAPGSELIPGLASVLISRFMLNLRQVDLHSHSQSLGPDGDFTNSNNSPMRADGHSRSFSAPQFRIPQSIVGNLGAELTDGYSDSIYDETETRKMEDEDDGSVIFKTETMLDEESGCPMQEKDGRGPMLEESKMLQRLEPGGSGSLQSAV